MFEKKSAYIAGAQILGVSVILRVTELARGLLRLVAHAPTISMVASVGGSAARDDDRIMLSFESCAFLFPLGSQLGMFAGELVVSLKGRGKQQGTP